jgi:hypothetical protein
MCTQSMVQYLEYMKHQMKIIFQAFLTLSNDNRINQSGVVNHVDLIINDVY